MWVPPEDKDPVLLHAPTRKSVACFGAVSLHTGKLVTTFEPKFNAESFQRFLELLLIHRPRGKCLALVLDNAKYHHARVLQPWLHQHRKLLTPLFLPPYSPELNPIERVWKLTRRLATHRSLPSTRQSSTLPVSSKAAKAMRQTLRSWALHNRSDKSIEDLARMFNPVVGAIQAEHTLVATGVYSLIRHPSYLGLLINSLGWGLAFRSALGVLLTVLLIPPLLARIRAEENLLRTHFGTEYEAYCARTSRLFPGLY